MTRSLECEVAAGLGMSFEYLDALSAGQVPLYGIAVLERQADELRRSCDLFLLPAEAIGGGKMQTLKRLNEEIRRLLGGGKESAPNPFAELEAKYIKSLADAAALGNDELVAHLERLYAMEAQDLRRKIKAESEAELEQTAGEIEFNMPPLVKRKLQEKARRAAEQ